MNHSHKKQKLNKNINQRLVFYILKYDKKKTKVDLNAKD